MQGKAIMMAALTTAIVVVMGCHHDKRNVTYTYKEEAVLPPNEERFNNPPTAEYQKPYRKKDDPSLLGVKGNSMGGPGGPGPIKPGGF